MSTPVDSIVAAIKAYAWPAHLGQRVFVIRPPKPADQADASKWFVRLEVSCWREDGSGTIKEIMFNGDEDPAPVVALVPPLFDKMMAKAASEADHAAVDRERNLVAGGIEQ